MIYSKEYLIDTINKFNNIDNIEEDWKKVFDVLTEEQSNIILQFLKGSIDPLVARERVNAIKWLMEFINRAKTQYKRAKGILLETDIPQFPNKRKE